jgi:opacity protein-like surface antigen
MRRGLIILMIILYLGGPGAVQPALALPLVQPGTPAIVVLAYTGLLSTGISLAAYYMWKNSPCERARGYRENLGQGEWLVAAYAGLSYLPAQDWQFFSGFAPELKGRTAQQVSYQQAFLGGIKFGRYFDTLPWLGLEMEMNLSKHAIPGQNVRISPSLAGGPNSVPFPPDRFFIWDTQINLLFRYGFLKDKEVPFGRLQPYVGTGPGFEVLYGLRDSAKNLAIEALAGLRYMCTPKVAVFLEYKFSYQFGVELEQFQVRGRPPVGTMSFDVPHHRFALGVSCHFKNLFGN